MYKVFKDHAELADYNTLAAAKKLAEKQHGEVFCDGKKVYPAEQDGSADMSTTDTQDAIVTISAENGSSRPVTYVKATFVSINTFIVKKPHTFQSVPQLCHCRKNLSEPFPF